MTGNALIDKATAILQAAGYNSQPTTLSIANLDFSFGAILTGANRLRDLIVIADTAEEPEDKLRDRLVGLGRALDARGSRRPLTAILIGPKPKPSTIESMSKVCRVLALGRLATPNDDLEMRDWLSVLLPLDTYGEGAPIAEPLDVLEEQLGRLKRNPFVVRLVKASKSGPPAVENELRTTLSLSSPNDSRRKLE